MPLRKISSILLSLALFAVLPLYQALAKGVVNEPQYTYTEAICTKGRLEQKQLCQSLSAEALVFRLSKGFTNQDPNPNFYAKWVRKLVNQKTNPQELADLLAAQNPSTQSTNSQVEQLYLWMQCKNSSQAGTAINQWAKQIDANQQNRSKIALYLAKKRVSATCLENPWRNFIDTIADVNLNGQDDPEPTLQDVSLSCEVASGANSCTTTAPQYCLTTLSTQPAHGTSVISGSSLTYTKSGSSTTTENYAHLRQNGSATAKCNVTITFAVSVNTLQDVSLSCEVASGANSCTTTAPQYCLTTLSTQPAHGTSVISGSSLTYTKSGSSTTTENYAHLRQNGSATAKCNVTITFAVSVNTLQDVSVGCTVQYKTGQINQCVVSPAPQYCQAGLITQPAHGVSTISGGNIIYQATGSSLAEENYAHARQQGSEIAKCNVKVTFVNADPTGDPDDPNNPDNTNKFHIAIIGAGYDENSQEWKDIAQQAQIYLSINPVISDNSSKVVFHNAASSTTLGCSGANGSSPIDAERVINCDNDNSYTTVENFIASRGISADKVAVLLATSNSGTAQSIGAKYSTTGMMGGPSYDTLGGTLQHEFAHTMGLSDEYLYNPAASRGNLTQYGQCLSSPPGQWGSITPASNWNIGCGYTDLYRPSADSIMRSHNSSNFNDVSIEVMRDHFKDGTIYIR